MKKSLIIGLGVASLAAAVSSLISVGVSAGPLNEPDAHAAADRQAGSTLAPGRIAAGVRAAGLAPYGAPVLRGRYYVLDAVDARGTQMHVLADAQFGDILSILPARHDGGAYRTSFGAAPRIIHIPQPEDAIAEGDAGDNAAAPDTGLTYIAPPRSEMPPPVRRVRPAPRPRSEVPRVKRHVVTSAPPPPPHADEMDSGNDKALTPVYPTPNFSTNVNGGEKFDPPPRASEALPTSPRLE